MNKEIDWKSIYPWIDTCTDLAVIPKTSKEIVLYHRNGNYKLIAAEKIRDMIERTAGGYIPFEFSGVLRPFQVTGVLYAIEKKRTFIADEMGLGKTLQALVATRSLEAYPCLILCPNSLKFNWRNEIEKWLPSASHYVFTPSNLLSLSIGTVPENLQFYILNYDLLKQTFDDLKKIPFKAIILDESHYLKNENALRTSFVHKLSKQVEYIFCLTGTPTLNRPMELISQLKIMRRMSDFGGEGKFIDMFCVKGYGGRLIAVKDLDILNFRLRETCYIRRNKKDVLKELPEKQKSIIPIEIDNRNEYIKAETSLIYHLKSEANKFGTLDGFLDESKQRYMANALVRIETLKLLTARGKLKSILEWVEDFLESGEKLVIYAHHIEIQKAIFEYFDKQKSEEFNVATLFSEQEILERQNNVDKFQIDVNCKLMVCSLQLGGLGITLTAASNVAFVELGWNPATHDQAEDRVHRIGQRDAVMAYYFLGEETIDDDIYALIQKKKIVVDATHEGNNPSAQMSILSQLIDKLRRKNVKS